MKAIRACVGLLAGVLVLACGSDGSGGRSSKGIAAGGSGGGAGAGGSGGAVGEGGTGGVGGSGGSGQGGDGGSGGEALVPYDDPTGRSGTRLRRRYFEAGTGAWMTTDFWDTELEVACSFRTAVDGAIRCLPRTFDDVYYTDAGCSEPFIGTFGDWPPACSDGWAMAADNRIYRRTGEPAVLSGGRVYYRTSTGCEAIAILPQEAWTLELVPASRFVRGQRVDEARADGLVARFVEGDDGSRALLEVVHQTRGYTCSFTEDGRCLPQRRSSRMRYADAACTQPLAYYSVPEPPPLIAFEGEDNACLQPNQVWETGPRFEGSRAYRRTDEGCVEFTVLSWDYYYRLGAEIPAHELPRATRTTEGDGRLLARRWVDSNGDVLGRAYAFWDTAFDEECEPVQVGADQLACVPRARGRAATGVYSSPGCAPGTEIALASSCLGSAPRLLSGVQPAGVCPAVPNLPVVDGVYERGPDVGPSIWVQGVSDCFESTYGALQRAYGFGPDASGELPYLELKME